MIYIAGVRSGAI